MSFTTALLFSLALQFSGMILTFPASKNRDFLFGVLWAIPSTCLFSALRSLL